MASDSINSGSNSTEEMKTALLKAQADLKESLEQNRKLAEATQATQDTVANLKKELESLKSSNKFFRKTSSMNPRHNDFSKGENGGDNHPDDGVEEIPLEVRSDIVAAFKAQNRKFMRLIHSIPGAPVPVAIEAVDGYSRSPFVEEISRAQLPEGLIIPATPKLYDGTTDPADHVAQYKQRIWQLSIPSHLVEATMCRFFGATLCGPALQWLINLKSGSISSFAGLINKFYQQFSSSMAIKKHSSDLYRVVQLQGETTRSYLDRFNKEMISIPNLDIFTAMEAFRRGLFPRSRLYYELTRYPCVSFEEVRTRAMAQIRVEEDKPARE